MLHWDFIIDVPEDVVLTDETVDGFLQGFFENSTVKERDTVEGTYPTSPWVDSRFSIPEAASFGTKRIPGTDPFYFVNQADVQGTLNAHFGHLEEVEEGGV